MIYDTYACRKAKGSHQAVDRFQMFCRQNKYVLKCDVKSYFASIDHEVLFGLILRKIKDPQALWLIKTILDSTPSPGIPIGNLTSQIFANLYLNGLDHYHKETLKCGYYARYMDDLVVFADDKSWLGMVKKEIQKYLTGLRLVLHANKSQIYQTRKGVAFLGYKIFPSHKLVLKPNIKRFNNRMKKYFRLLRNGQIARQKIYASVRSWFDYAMYADSYKLRKTLIENLVF